MACVIKECRRGPSLALGIRRSESGYRNLLWQNGNIA
jgi:hypothetical protein